MEREKALGRVFVLPILLDDVWADVQPQEFQNRLYLKCFDQSAAVVKAVSQQLAEQIFAWLSTHLDESKKTDVSRPARRARLTEAMIQLSATAEEDCKTLHIPSREPAEFVLGEATRHPILFDTLFTSLPLVFRENVLLLSWNGSQATIERVLNREKAYPLNDAWNSCLALYRQATLLPYRTKGPEQLYASTEARRTLSVYRRLISNVKGFMQLLRDNNQDPPDIYQDLDSLIEEAVFAFANNDIGAAVARLEVVLSTVHKLILQYAPQGPLSKKIAREAKPAVEVSHDGRRTVLVIDDNLDWLLSFHPYLVRNLSLAVTAVSSATDALRAMVEQEFDLVITDLVLGPGDDTSEVDGREIAIAAKRSSEKTKVIVVTGYGRMSRPADLIKAGVDALISKENAVGNAFEEKIEELLGRARRADR
jgi:CheY-like chemotaxis protein